MAANIQLISKQQLNKIKNGMDKYEEGRSRQSGFPIEQIIQQSLNPILPTYWEVFHTRNIQRIQNQDLPRQEENVDLLRCYDVGIFLVGFSSLPIALSLAEIRPLEKIYFLYSRDTKETCYEIADRMGAMLAGQTCFAALIDCVNTIALDIQENNDLGCGLEIDDPSDPVKTFKRIKEVIDKVGDKRIALDLTGGKKTMIGGGFTAGSILGFADSIADSACDMFYIDSLEYNQRSGSPTPGTEFLTRLDNPYNVYNVQSVQQAKKLFEKHNYEAAADLWGEAVQKLKTSIQEGSKSPAEQYGLKDEQKVVQTNLGMASCYRFWDAFDYQAAKNCKSFSFHDPDAKRDLMHSWGYNKQHVHNSIDILDILSETDNRQTTFQEEARVIHLAVDRYQNAMRRKDAGKFDDAIGRFVQTLEIICPYHFYQIAQNGGLFDRDSKACLKDEIDPDNEEWNIIPLIRFLFKFEGNDWYFGRQRVYVIQEPGNHLEPAEYGSVSALITLIRFRNDLVHVNKSTRQKEIEENAIKLQQRAKKFLKNLSGRYISEQGLEFDELLKLHRFRLVSLAPVEQLVEELGCLSDKSVDEERATQIYKEQLPSLDGDDKQLIAQALRAYWQRINKWKDISSNKQREKVREVQSILGGN